MGESFAGARPSFEAARRVGEGLVITIVTSTGLYLIGTVWTDAYYGRLSVEVTALDLSPPYIALQSIHVLRHLLAYPLGMFLLWIVWRAIGDPVRRLANRSGNASRRFPRLVPIVANLVIAVPLVIGALSVVFREEEAVPRSVVTEATDVLGTAVFFLVAYLIWLGWRQRRFVVSEIRNRQLIPIVLAVGVYLLTALAATSVAAELAAERLLAGASDASLRVTFVTKEGVLPELEGKRLILVTVRSGAYYVVEQAVGPAGQRPTSYVVPFDSVEAARVQRMIDAEDLMIGEAGEP